MDNNDLCMPNMINFKIARHHWSPHLTSQPKKNYILFSAMKSFCCLVLRIAATMSQPTLALSCGQACVHATIYQCILINLNFDSSCNHTHHMVMSAGNPNDENYTFWKMEKQDDAAECIKVLQKEMHDHESWGHWEIIKQSVIMTETKTIQDMVLQAQIMIPRWHPEQA